MRPSSPSLSRRRPRASRSIRPGLDRLEGRTVLSADFQSVLAIGNDAVDVKVFDNAVDAAGNSYVVGTLYGPTDLDLGVVRPDGSDVLTPRGTTDPFVAKYAPDGSLLWARRMGSATVGNETVAGELAKSLDVDAAGNVYVTGQFVGQGDFGPYTLTSAGSKDGFAVKIGPTGNVLWAKNWGGVNTDYGYGVSVDPSGNMVVAGFEFTEGSGYTGFTVTKYGPTGTMTWTKEFDGFGSKVNALETDAAGNIYVTGNFWGAMDFNPDPRKTNSVTGATGLYLGSSWGRNAFVLKLTSAGAYSWVAPIIAKTTDANIDPNDLALDPSGNVVLVGRYAGQLDFDPASNVDYRLNAGQVGFVEKFSPAGARLWAVPIGGGIVRAVAVDAAGAIYAAGVFTSTPFSPGNGLPSVTSQGLEDVFVAGLAPSGSVSWAETFGGSSSDVIYGGIALGAGGSIQLAGYSLSPVVEYDPDPLDVHELTNPAYFDFFILKLKKR